MSTWWSDKTEKEKDRCRECPFLDWDGRYMCCAPRDEFDRTQACCFCAGACSAFYFECGIERDDFDTAKEAGKIVREYYRKRNELKNEYRAKLEKMNGVIA